MAKAVGLFIESGNYSMMYRTHLRGFRYFLEVTGACFEGAYPGKASNIGELAIESMKVGKRSWVREQLVN